MSSLPARKRPVALVVEHLHLVGEHERLSDAVTIAGFRVIACDAEQVHGALANRKDVRVIITDLDTLSQIDGSKLSSAVRNTWPPVKMIVTDGFTPAEQHKMLTDLHLSVSDDEIG
jgi:DNA-binding response OmpR family regulator